MRVSRLFMAAGLALIVAISSVAILSAQAKTDEDYDKLMKAVGAANGTMRARPPTSATVAAEAKKLQALFKDAQQFWTARKNTEAAEWAASAMTHAAEIEKAATANNMERRGGAPQGARRRVPDVPQGNREKTETGFAIQEG